MNNLDYVNYQIRRKSLRELPSLLTTEQMAVLLDLRDEKQVSRMCKAGVIKAAKIGKRWYISRDWLMKEVEGIA